MKENQLKVYHRATEIKDWINSKEFEKLKDTPKEIRTRLKAAGIWRRYLEQSLKDYIKNNYQCDEKQDLGDEEEKVWKNLSQKKLGLNREEVGEKLKTNKALKLLSIEKWENNVESIF